MIPKSFLCDNPCRLFPDGRDGNGSELADKPAAPVHPFHPKMAIRRGILELECADVMQQFFQLRRRKKEKKEDSPPQPSCLPITNPQSKILGKMQDIFHAMFCL
jgi:tRNA(adenine34) deaminase